MANKSQQFDSYKVWCYTPGPTYDALVYCYLNGSLVGTILFVKDEQVVDSVIEPNGRPRLTYPFSRFGDVMTLLREEEPLYLFVSEDIGLGIVGTSEQEPVGEEEGSGG